MPHSKVLIVDDSQVDRMILKRAFHKAALDDFELEEASDAGIGARPPE